MSFGGLYDDIPTAKDAPSEAKPKPKPPSWTASLLPPALRQRPSATPAPPRPPPRPPQPPAPPPPPPPAALPAAPGPSMLVAVEDEYDPSKPNSYEEAVRQRALRRKQEELDEKRQRLATQLQARRAAAADAAPPAMPARVPSLPPPEQYPPPPLVDDRLPPPPPLPVLAPPLEGVSSVAEAMMARMGWTTGQALGRASELPPRPPPSRVLCLRGMVGPGEIDDALEDEVASECARHGPVVRVLLFERDPGAPPEEAVTVFVEFVRSEAAQAARAELDGRFFGGRRLGATLFDEARLDALDLV